MITKESVVQQIFEDLEELLMMDERLEVSFYQNGRLNVSIVDRQDGRMIADRLGRVVNILADRLT